MIDSNQEENDSKLSQFDRVNLLTSQLTSSLDYSAVSYLRKQERGHSKPIEESHLLKPSLVVLGDGITGDCSFLGKDFADF